MGRELLGASVAFKAGVQKCADALAPLGVDLMAEYAKADGWGSPLIAAIGLTSLQVSATCAGRSRTYSCQAR